MLKIHDHLQAAGVDLLPDEVWAPAHIQRWKDGKSTIEVSESYAVSTAGRVFSLPRLVHHRTKAGQTLAVNGGLLSITTSTSIGSAGQTWDLARAVLCTFDRPQHHPGERAWRRWHFLDCALDSLRWCDDIDTEAAREFFDLRAAGLGLDEARQVARRAAKTTQAWTTWAEQATGLSRVSPHFWTSAMGALLAEEEGRQARREANIARWRDAR